jgi:hypothetical protein
LRWDAVTEELNSRPRKTLGFLTSAEALAYVLGGQVMVGGRDAGRIAPGARSRHRRPKPPARSTLATLKLAEPASAGRGAQVLALLRRYADALMGGSAHRAVPPSRGVS